MGSNNDEIEYMVWYEKQNREGDIRMRFGVEISKQRQKNDFDLTDFQNYQTVISGNKCRVSHNGKRAITLKSANSKFRNDILQVIIATYH